MTEKVQHSAKTAEVKRENSASKTRAMDYSQSMSSPVDQIHSLQRTIGNQAVQRLIKSGALQAKLKIGQPGDKYEQEADRMAEQVMSMPEPKISKQEEDKEEEVQAKPLTESITPLVHRESVPEEEEKPAQAKMLQRQEEEEEEEVQKQPEEEEEETAQAKGDGGPSTAAPSVESNINYIQGVGQPLSESTRTFFEPRFGADFSDVRVHSDSDANHLARSVNAKAFTVGRDVVFGSGQFSPETTGGKKLLAHELTHVMQQNGGGGVRLKKTSPHFPLFIQRKAGDVLKVNQFNLTMFLSSYESGSLVPPVATKDYLTNPPLLKMALELKDLILHNHKQGLPPMSLTMLLFMAAGRTSHMGTTLLLCHNVTKGFARGSKALNITKLSKRDYYKFFDKKSLGDTDPGDWYHYFVMTLPAYYFTKGKVETKRPTLPKESATMGMKRDFMMAFLKLIAGKMILYLSSAGVTIPSSKAYTSWLNANALSFLEGVYWGHNQKEVNGESRVHLKGAKRGISLAGQKTGRTWKWFVPICKGFIIPGKSKTDSILESYTRLSKQGIMPFTYEIWDIDGKLVKKGYTKVPSPPPVKSPSPSKPSPPSSPAKPSKPNGGSGCIR